MTPEQKAAYNKRYNSDPAHQALNKKRLKARYERFKAASKCYSCGANTNGQILCEMCKKHRAQYITDLRSKGTCLRCKSNPSAKGRTQCPKCLRLAVTDIKQRRQQGEHLNWNQRLRIETFKAYGGFQCICCGITEPMMLTIDHIKGHGNEHRKECLGIKYGNIAGLKFYRWLRANGYPKGFQVLCFNCNCAKRRNGGVCPLYGKTH